MVVASSQRAAQMWSQPLGLLFIDGGHTDEQAQADYESWALHVARPRALAIPTTCSPIRPTAARRRTASTSAP